MIDLQFNFIQTHIFNSQSETAHWIKKGKLRKFARVNLSTQIFKDIFLIEVKKDQNFLFQYKIAIIITC